MITYYRIAREFVARLHSLPENRIRIRLRPLSGGLENAYVYLVCASTRSVDLPKCVIKVIPFGHREAAAYTAIAAAKLDRLTPQLLAIHDLGSSRLLFLEWVRAWRTWPWHEISGHKRVFRQLQRLHLSNRDLYQGLSAHQDAYETELAESAKSTLEFAQAVVKDDDLQPIRYLFSALKRVVKALPEIRRRLKTFGQVVLHGDVHSGNVIMSNFDGVPTPILLDWGRWRVGSPLEDVCSWIYSIGFWEPQARRFHDTLFSNYFAMIDGSRFTTALRDACSLAGTCNALSGVLRYHLWCATSSADVTSAERAVAVRAVRYWMNALRRGDQVLLKSR